MEKTIQEKNYEFFTNNYRELFKKYPNKFLIIKDCRVDGAFNSFEDAFNNAITKFKIGTFLVQQCSDNNIKAQHFYSYELIRV